MIVDAGERLQRILRVIPLIVDHEQVSIEEVKAIAGVDAITLLDDLRALTEREDEPGGFVEAVSILFDSECVSVRSPQFGRPVRVTLPELCALELGLAMLGASTGRGEREMIERARAKVREAIVTMPATAGEGDLWYAAGPPVGDERILETVRDCVARRMKAKISYRRGDAADVTERVVHPYAVLPVRGAWFIVAHCERANALRFFRLDRVESAAAVAEGFAPRTDVDLSAILAADRALVSPSGERLVVRYAPRIARWISEREEGEHEADGAFIVHHPLADDAWAVRHVLQYGSEAEVLAPPRIRDRLAATLRDMALVG